MNNKCPACGAPINDDAKYCSYCGTKYPDNIQRYEIKSEIKIEDKAKLEEIRLKYEMEEKERLEKSTSNKGEFKSLKVKLWISWILFIVLFSAAIYLSIQNDTMGLPLAVFSIFIGIYAIITTFSWIFKKIISHKKNKAI